MKVIARIKGGLGNQLFCYAAARRLALVNDAELVIDDVTGFVRDHQYRRQYALDRFDISARKATPSERLEPFDRYRRVLAKWLWGKHMWAKKRYVEQEGLDFDERLLSIKVKEMLYLDGLWQSESYFKDIESTIRQDLRINPPKDAPNQRMAEEIRSSQAVALHVRWFDAPDNSTSYNIAGEYYRCAREMIEERVKSPHYFLFSDNPEAAQAKLGLPKSQVTLISHNQGDENAYADLWLMTQCQHFVTANSTFSWWGAWLGDAKEKLVITPGIRLGDESGIMAWGFKGLIPTGWVEL